MDRLTTLPDEILVDIVERVHAAPPDILPALGLTCKTFRRLCRHHLRKGVVVPWRLNKHSPMSKFIVFHKGNADIRSIRLCPQRAVLNAFRIKMKSAYDHVDPMCTFLSGLPSLATFSIYLDGQIDRRCAMPGPVLAKIIRALPKSLRNLELDTESTDEVWETVVAYHKHATTACMNPQHDHRHPTEDPNTHLCRAISEHVPRLETLSLRLSCICTELFLSLSSNSSSDGTQPASTLRRAVITFDVGENTERHAELHVELRDCNSAPTGHTRYTSQGATTLEKQKVFKHLLDLQAAGAFPDLQRFIVFSWHTDGEFPTRYLNVRDVATRSVKKFPKLKEMNGTGPWPVQLEDFMNETRYLVKGDDQDERMSGNFLGHRNRMERAVLHEVVWREEKQEYGSNGDGGGMRIPPSTETLEDETVRLGVEELVEEGRAREFVDVGRMFPNLGGFERARVVVERL